MLSERTARGIADLLRIMLTASDGLDAQAWSRSLEAGFRSVLGADMVGLSIPSATGPIVYASPEARRWGMAHYMDERLPKLERQWGTETRLLDLGVSSRRSLHANHLVEYYRGEMWNEFIVPNRFYDTVAMACRVAPGVNGFVFLIHGTKSGRRFGRTGLNALRALYPAFCASTRAICRQTPAGSEIARLVDVLPTALILGDRNGSPTHRNSALLGMLAREPESLPLVHAMNRMLHLVAVSGREGCVRPTLSLWRDGVHDEVRIGRSTYRLSGSLLAGRGVTTAAHAMVVVERFGPPPFPEDELRTRLLTPREIQVARFVAEGASTEAIASALGISLFTARHHLERVMHKLSAHSRAELTARLAQLAHDALLTPNGR